MFRAVGCGGGAAGFEVLCLQSPCSFPLCPLPAPRLEVGSRAVARGGSGQSAQVKFGSNGFLMKAVQPGSQQDPLWSN